VIRADGASDASYDLARRNRVASDADSKRRAMTRRRPPIGAARRGSSRRDDPRARIPTRRRANTPTARREARGRAARPAPRFGATRRAARPTAAIAESRGALFFFFFRVSIGALGNARSPLFSRHLPSSSRSSASTRI
jgi:hypothetical protein